MFISLCEAVTLISDVESQQRHSPKIALHIHSMKIRGALHFHACHPRSDLEPLLCLLKNNDRSAVLSTSCDLVLETRYRFCGMRQHFPNLARECVDSPATPVVR